MAFRVNEERRTTRAAFLQANTARPASGNDTLFAGPTPFGDDRMNAFRILATLAGAFALLAGAPGAFGADHAHDVELGRRRPTR